MKKIFIFSNNLNLIDTWSVALSPIYHVESIDDIYAEINADVVIVDSEAINNDENLYSLFSDDSIRFLIVGSDWPEINQITALTSGAAGYCDESEAPPLLRQSIEHILKGELWIQRLLVPKVIGSLVKMKSSPVEPLNKSQFSASKQLIQTLSARELDVAKMILAGKNNRTIASTLNISERTVKAHLTSIFKKLDIPDRLHLAVFIKELA